MSRPSDREPRSAGKPEGRRGAQTEKGSTRRSDVRAVPDEVARIHTIRTDKPQHGQKRRSSQKRHEVSVVRELHLHPEESPAEAGRAVRIRPPAEVIDVTAGLRRREARTDRPAAATETTPSGLVQRVRSEAKALALQGFEKLMETVARVVTLPGEVVRTIRDLRHREA